MIAKVSTTNTYDVARLQVQERTVIDGTVLWLPHRKCLVKISIGHKYYVRHRNEKILNCFSGSSSITNEPHFKIVSYSTIVIV